MEKKLDKSFNELIDVVKTSNDYKECIRLKEEMSTNKEICSLVKEIKEVQKAYVKSCYDKDIKVKLDILNDKLMNIPIYYSYNNHLEEVNRMINYIKDDLNDYFYKLLNDDFN